MEVDNEVSGNGNSYTTEFRQYDPRLGRWKSLDPLMAQFPWQSPYAAFDNNPILKSDPRGDAAKDPNAKQKKELKRYKKLEKRMDRKFTRGTPKYQFKLWKKARKSRYGSKTKSSNSRNDTQKIENPGNSGQDFSGGYDLTQSEVKEIESRFPDGPNVSYPSGAGPRGTEGAQVNSGDAVSFENVEDGEEIAIKARTTAGFQVEIWVDGKKVTTFKEAPQKVANNVDASWHPEVNEVKTIAIKTGSTKPKNMDITVIVVFTEDGAKVHRDYPNMKVATVTFARKLDKNTP